MDNKKTALYIIKGGIGKCVVFSSMIKKLAQKDDHKISVACGFPGVFKFHPQVEHVLKSSTGDALEKVAEQFDDIIFREPYVSNYCKGDRHILDEWTKLYDLEPFAEGGINARPDLEIGDAFINEAKKIKQQIKQKFFIVQWTGGQPPMNLRKGKKYPNNKNIRERNIKNYQQIWSALAEAFPEHLFLLYALPNEPIKVPPQLKGRVASVKARSLSYAALLKEADSFIALDSSLQHFAASLQADKKGVVLWGQRTTPEQIGYSFHSNLSSQKANEVIIPAADVVNAVNKIVSVY